MKKFIFLILGFGCIIGLLNGAQAATITVGSSSGAPGSQAIIPVTIDDTAGRFDCSFSVYFDNAKLEYVGRTPGDMGATVLTATLSEINAAGKVQPIVQFEEGGATSGTIVNLKFTIKDSVSIGDVIPLTISDIVPADTYSGVSGSIAVTQLICTVAITPPSATLFEGTSQTFTASTSGQGCATGIYTWSIVSTIGSTITQQGVYTAGSTDIQVTDTVTVTDTANGNITATATVTVKPTTCTIAITPPSATVKEGEAKIFRASTTGENCSTGVYTWSVTSTIGSTITQQGVYTAGSTDIQVTDTVTVTDTANGNITTQAIVTVSPKELVVTIIPPSATLPSGGNQQFTAITTVDGQVESGTYTWQISPASTIGSSISSFGIYNAGSNNSSNTVTETIVVTDTAHRNASATAIVSVLPVPPSIPVLVSPENGNTSIQPLPTFTWEASERATSYQLKVGTDPEFSEASLVIVQLNLVTTTFTPSIPLSSEPYAPFYWQVTAVNEGGGVSSLTSLFILNVSGPQELTSEELRYAKDSTDISAYQMISVPLDLENEAPLVVLGFEKCDSAVWRLFRYDSSMVTETSEVGDCHEYDCNTYDAYMDFKPGRAFWLITTAKELMLNVMGNPVPTDTQFSIFLQSGWNQIGNPFAFDVDWINTSVIDENGQEKPINQQDLIEFDPIANTSLWEWGEEGGYDRPQIMKPWHGYWVYVTRTTDTGFVELRVPPIASSITLGTSVEGYGYYSPDKPGFPSPQINVSDESNFAIKLMVKGKKTRDTYNYVGIFPESSIGYDDRDIFEPPLLSNKQISLYFPHEDWEDMPGMYATDFRPPTAIDEPFTFIISGGGKGEKVTLTWSGVKDVPMGYSVVLVDVKKGKTVDMRKVSAYTYKTDKKREREFQIALINHSFSNLLDDKSINFLEDELDDEPMGDLDLY